MEKKRSFKQLEKSFVTCNEFNKFCKNLTEEYANSEAQFARSYFTENYNISVDCYYKVLEYAVVTNLVEDITVTKMMNKAVSNQNLHQNGAGGSSIAKYARMYTKRCQYIAITFTDKEIKRMALDFGDNPDISKADLAASYGIARKVLELLLVRAIEENIVDDKTVDAIERRSIKNAKPENVQMTKDYFAALRKKREANQKGITLE